MLHYILLLATYFHTNKSHLSTLFHNVLKVYFKANPRADVQTIVPRVLLQNKSSDCKKDSLFCNSLWGAAEFSNAKLTRVQRQLARLRGNYAEGFTVSAG